jgi:signal peptidase II
VTAKLRVFGIALALALPLDQLSKLWIASHAAYGVPRPVIEGFFYLTYVRNPGAAFSLFAGAPEAWRVGGFIGLTLVAIVAIFSFLRRLEPGDRLSAAALGLILAGAIGNLIDRVRFKEVVDFLDFRLIGGYVWPTFNLADSFIVVGTAFLVLTLFLQPADGEAARARNTASAGPDA